MSPRRSNRVAEFAAVVVAYGAGVAAAFASPSPTGRPLVDALLLGISVAVVTYAGASAPWWATVVAGGAAVAIAVDPILIAIGAVALGIGLLIGARQRSLPGWRAISIGISMNVLARSELEGVFGLSAAVAIAVGVLVFVVGMRRRPVRIRRVAWAGAGVVATLAVLATLAFGITAARARADLESGQDQVEAGIDLLNEGEFALAADQFDAASASLRDVEDQLGSPWGSAASVVPVVAQHRAAAVDTSSAGSVATAQIAAALRRIDPATLGVDRGRIDLEAVAALAQPFTAMGEAMDMLAVEVDTARSPWLVSPVSDELASLSERIDEHAPRLDNARDAVALAPQMLGGDGTRRYLVLFTTPAEARGVGGFPGNFAELTIDDGRIEMTRFGRVAALERQARRVGARVEDAEEFLASYGRFGFDTDGNGLVGEAPFRNLTMTPDFPSVGAIATDLYRQVTGTEVDGVIAIDPFVLARLLSYTDGIELTSAPVRLTADNATDFLLREQYAITPDQETRIDALEEAARGTFDALLAGAMPDPAALGRDLGPLAAERRLLVWTADSSEQDLLQRVGLLGGIPPHDSADGWAFIVNNAAANKLDTYLERRAAYESTTDPATGQTIGTLRVQLTNAAPLDRLPAYTIGNAVGLPEGTSRLYVSFYTPLHLSAATQNGEEVDTTPGREANWNVYSRFVDIPPGATVTLEFRASGRLDRPDELVTWTQPLVLPLQELR
jgi:hypothetical protein